MAPVLIWIIEEIANNVWQFHYEVITIAENILIRLPDIRKWKLVSLRN
jgi:hypothetical protein